MEDKVGDVFENLMRPRRRSTIEQPSNNSGASLPDDHEHIPDQSTGIGRTPSGLAQRRPWRPIEHQDVDLPVRMPVMREARVNFRVLRSTMAIWMINRVIVYAVFVALIVGSAVTAGLAAWKAQTESSSRQPKLSYDDNFYGSISQGLGSILGVFCIVIPLVERNRELQPDIPVWCPQTFRWLLGFSVVTAVFSMATQRFEEVESIVFGYVSMATQLVATMLLVVGSTETITQRQRAFDQLSTKHLIISGALQNVRQQAAANAAAL
ncbi:uncharacterized protein K460DRAFT_210959 [Cucurbitaria berberidis CBS 394.84]|uniref:Uncharacterized protein n=1 Tax=Cucurbitaria berberidis CBS 394.84 TaxID=1168544 RepID=A0A9P4G7X6_9PLEO|nr:uncharacterized protein K460DRAFT_210959 [Cucurbitaria berberidis CBS 394.84]KAF1840567.1 hypothetical protein K460DRAFT_210959 [Cucurbitaria berberidis CBS 394.84]